VVALILADGDVPDPRFLAEHWPRWSDDIDLVIAADGGARHAAAFDLRVDLWVGDGDSIDPTALASLADAGTLIERSRPDKDETDTELAIRAALAREARGVLVLGATGGPRIDHELANIALLAMPELIGMGAILYTPRSTIRLLRAVGTGPDRAAARMPIAGAIGDTVSLLPFGVDAVGVSTSGLRYPLDEAVLPIGTPRGVSNVVAARPADVALRSGLLLVIESPATIGG
jgi:thiamine pyrophosphokinase